MTLTQKLDFSQAMGSLKRLIIARQVKHSKGDFSRINMISRLPKSLTDV